VLPERLEFCGALEAALKNRDFDLSVVSLVLLLLKLLEGVVEV
jgi:hypothetical protein